MKLLNVGCGTHYAKGWVNVDVWEDNVNKPDVLVTPGKPYPFDDDEFDAIFMGHVLEHISWPLLGDFLKDINRIAKPGCPVLAVGPDVYKTIQRWKNNQEPWHMVESVMEHQDVESVVMRLEKDVEAYNGTQPEWWDGAAHHWNCHETRMLSVMSSTFDNCSVYSDKVKLDPQSKWWSDDETGITWPVVGYWHWQSAVIGYATQ